MSTLPSVRLRHLRSQPAPSGALCVLAWLNAQRRCRWNFALEYAVACANERKLPLVVVETLHVDQPWACDRFHRFVMDGMDDNAAVCRQQRVTYLGHVETTPGSALDLLETLSTHASLLVGDAHPTGGLRELWQRLLPRLRCAVDQVDGNGLIPLAASDKEAPTAYVFRRFAQRVLPGHLDRFPVAEPLKALQNRSIPTLPDLSRWQRSDDLSRLPIDHAVPPVALRGGARAAETRLTDFLAQRLARYPERNDPAVDSASGFSPYLRYGHLSAHQVVAKLLISCGWSKDRLGPKATGKREGWWGAPPAVEAFLDQIVVWRELGYHFCQHRPDHATYPSLPAWARATLAAHAGDRREHLYTREQFTAAETHDPLWNAAQRQLRRDGVIHNYLRMIWGKKILEWSASPEEAFATMIALNDRWALDGSDPNSYSGIGWCLGRFDRPWAPQRPVFGSIRFMSSANTARKFDVDGYLERYRQL